MAFWSFGNRTATAQPVAAVDPAAYNADVKHAYEHGRQDERSRRRRGFGPLSFLVLVAAVIGVVLIVFAVQQGSFSAGGAVVDNKLDQATSSVAPAIDNAASKTGTAMETAGQDLKNQGAAIAGKAPDSGAPAGGQ